MTKLKPGSVNIPLTPTGSALEEAAAIKREMIEWLRDVEIKATGGAKRPYVTKFTGQTGTTNPGAWRHDPPGWASRHSLT